MFAKKVHWEEVDENVVMGDHGSGVKVLAAKADLSSVAVTY